MEDEKENTLKLKDNEHIREYCLLLVTHFRRQPYDIPVKLPEDNIVVDAGGNRFEQIISPDSYVMDDDDEEQEGIAENDAIESPTKDGKLFNV